MIKLTLALSRDQRVKIVPYYLGHFLIYLGFLIITLVIVWLIFRINRVYTSYQVTTQHLAALEALVSSETINPGPTPSDLAQVEEDLRNTVTNLEMLCEASTPFLPLVPYLGWVPVYGDDIQAMPHLLAAGRDLGRTGMILVEALSPLLKPESEISQTNLFPNTVTALAHAKVDLAQAEALLRQHQSTIDELDVEHLSPRVAYRAIQLEQFLPQVISALQLAQDLPILFGAEAPQTYLLMTQNSDELRPTGGYINTAGHIVFDHGQIVEFVMQDSYAVDWLSEDYPYPPAPLYQYMAADYWVLRDASWSPDFPTTARTAMDLYERGQGVSTKGVIAIDQHALPYLLRVLEPLEVEGEQVTSDNVIKLMRQHWAPVPTQNLDHEWWLQRKSFMLALAEAIRQKIEQDFDVMNLPVLMEALAQALAEKHILIYMEDPTQSAFLVERNWAGLLQPVQGDYLMVVDANVGFNKASAVVERHLSYQVALAKDGSVEAHTSLVYQHHGQKWLTSCSKEPRYDPVYEQNMERCYWNYQRLVVPAKAQLLNGPQTVVEGQYLLRSQSTTGEIDVESLSSDKISWGQLFLLAPQESISLDYIYTLPSGTVHFVGDCWEYTLYLQKQPGTLAPPAEVGITLPDGAQFLNSQPLPSSQQERTITYQLSLITDQKINVAYTFP